MDDYIICELIGGGSPILLNVIKFVYCCYALHTIMLCIVAIVDLTHVHRLVHYKIIRTYHILLLLLNNCTHVGLATALNPLRTW